MHASLILKPPHSAAATCGGLAKWKHCVKNRILHSVWRSCTHQNILGSKNRTLMPISPTTQPPSKKKHTHTQSMNPNKSFRFRLAPGRRGSARALRKLQGCQPRAQVERLSSDDHYSGSPGTAVLRRTSESMLTQSCRKMPRAGLFRFGTLYGFALGPAALLAAAMPTATAKFTTFSRSVIDRATGYLGFDSHKAGTAVWGSGCQWSQEASSTAN